MIVVGEILHLQASFQSDLGLDNCVRYRCNRPLLYLTEEHSIRWKFCLVNKKLFHLIWSACENQSVRTHRRRNPTFQDQRKLTTCRRVQKCTEEYFSQYMEMCRKTISKVIWGGKRVLDAILSQINKKIGDRFHFQWHRRRLNDQFSNYVTDKINGSRVQPSLLGEGQRPDPGDGGNRAYRWRGCSRTVRLGIPQQFRQRPVSFDTPHTTAHSGTTGWRNSLSTVVASATIVSNTAKIVQRPPLRLPNWKHVFLRSTYTITVWNSLTRASLKGKIDCHGLTPTPCFTTVFALGHVHIVAL